MKSNPYRSHSVAGTVAAVLIATVVCASLVESFEPQQLLQLSEAANADQTIVQARRADADAAEWT